jgi:hypothetical protein
MPVMSPARPIFEDEIDFYIALGAVVPQRQALLGKSQMFKQFTQHEGFN